MPCLLNVCARSWCHKMTSDTVSSIGALTWSGVTEIISAEQYQDRNEGMKLNAKITIKSGPRVDGSGRWPRFFSFFSFSTATGAGSVMV
jgi:hypothetical protein